MSTVITDNLTGKTAAGNVTITSEGGAATMQLQQGVAKAWLTFDGGGTITTYDSFGISSIADVNTGKYRYNLSSAMSNFVFATTLAQAVDDADGATDVWTTGFRANEGCLPRSTTQVTVGIFDGSYVDDGYISSSVLGDMA